MYCAYIFGAIELGNRRVRWDARGLEIDLSWKDGVVERVTVTTSCRIRSVMKASRPTDGYPLDTVDRSPR